MVFEYIQECFRAAYKYFACPQRRSAGVGRDKKRVERMGQQEEKESDDEDGLDLMGDERPLSSDSLLDSEDEENHVPEREAGSDDLLYVFDKMIFTGGKVKKKKKFYVFNLEQTTETVLGSFVERVLLFAIFFSASSS